jgi:hypothetical protein
LREIATTAIESRIIDILCKTLLEIFIAFPQKNVIFKGRER